MASEKIIIRDNLKDKYSDVYTPEVLSALESLSRFNKEIKDVMHSRIHFRKMRRM